jgi:hypothetical protein
MMNSSRISSPDTGWPVDQVQRRFRRARTTRYSNILTGRAVTYQFGPRESGLAVH